MSAPLEAKRDRNASRIWSRKSVIDGWPRRLGQIAAYIRTISTIEASQPRMPRRCSCKVLRKTLRSMSVLPGVVGEEGLLQLGLGTLEVHDGVPADLLDEGVERALRSTARQHVVLHGQVANAGESCEGCGVDRLGRRSSRSTAMSSPARRTPTRSAMRCTSLSTWELRRTVRPDALCSC